MNKFSPLLSKRFALPKADLAERAISSFSLTEKILFQISVGIFILSSVLLLWNVSNSYMVDVPDHGGELSEGIIGSPRFVNPLLAMSDADKDLVSLTYSGLMKISPKGEIIPDIAESYTISPDGLTYSFTIKKNAVFHDGKPITADDVLFTILKAQDPILKSPKRSSWDGITVTKISDTEISFSLKQPYGPFLENTTLGILPKHIWKDATTDQFSFSQYNISPIGSGPYKVASVNRNGAGIPIGYSLESFHNYISGEPFISNLTIKFYPDETTLLSAYKKGDIESGYGFSAETVDTLKKEGARIEQSTLPRMFAVFFNQNQSPVFANLEVRRALDTVLNKNLIVSQVLHGFGTSIDGPIPQKTPETSFDTRNEDQRIQEASSILSKAGWSKATSTNLWTKKDKKGSQTLSFSVATGDTPELKAAAQMIVNEWISLGAKVDLQIYETGDLNQNIIRPRKYDALFFGEIIGRNLDFYPFWHSSQRNDPGLNIALYVNTKVDKLLEDARATSDESARTAKYDQFAAILQNDQPVVFVYSPNFLYILPQKVQGLEIGQLTTPGERFANVASWYTDTNRIWNIFNH